MADQDCRQRLIDATLTLCSTGGGYEVTTVEQIAAAADLTPADFARYFATKDAAIMSIVDDVLRATAVALRGVRDRTSPEEALLVATTEVITAVIDGRGVITRDHMLTIAQLFRANPNLKRQGSLARKRVLAQALAARMGVGADNQRVRQAVVMWSAIAVGANLGRLSIAASNDPRQLGIERMIAELDGTFAEVMGAAPTHQN
jgi:AcrR family transcriptional regulator